MSVLLPVLMPFSVFSCHSKLGHFEITEANGNIILFLPDLLGGKWKKSFNICSTKVHKVDILT